MNEKELFIIPVGSSDSPPHFHKGGLIFLFFVFAEIPKTGRSSGKCTLWRLSFSEAEKELMLHADGLYRRGGERNTPATCRKDVLKILKSLLSDCVKDLKSTVGPERKTVMCSYMMKTLMMNMYNMEEYRDDNMWRDNDEGRRRMLKYACSELFTCLEQKHLTHHFLPDVNNFQNMGSKERQLLLDVVQNILDFY